MRVVTNHRLAKRNRQIAFWLMIGTLGVLVGSFILMMQGPIEDNPQISSLVLLFQVLVLPVAFVLTLVSVRMTNLWARPPRPEDAIEEGLKGLSNKSVLYNYYHFPARHVLICPQGIFAIVTRWHNGRYTVKGDRWQTKQSIFSRLGGFIRADGIGSPSLDAQRAAEKVQKQLSKIAPDVDVTPLIVFIDSTAEIEIEDSDIDIVFTDPKAKPSLKSYLRDLNKENVSTDKKQGTMPLTDEQIEAFEEATT
ncbi:MAG: NERD domain-containing protein [Anaerolineae bacterium]|nr:NERD domain-containing protein [Anaerolineae bacterium]MCA9888753.1 NERD domain-containing protein [Anaerolineae bacterium]